VTGKSVPQHMRADLVGTDARRRRHGFEVTGEVLARQVSALPE
jgi:hypothetical protein